MAYFEYLFLSTLPVRGATHKRMIELSDALISIHAPREGSDSWSSGIYPWPAPISIHAPREGSDKRQEPAVLLAVISIHAPREGSDF